MKKKKKKFIILIVNGLLLIINSIVSAQELTGYVSVMPSHILQQPNGDIWQQIPIHNRLNFNWQITRHLRIDAGIRNRFIIGNEALLDPEGIRTDPGWMQLSRNWAEGTRYVINTTFDRLFVTYEQDKWKLQAGRQRINWGQTFVWNPNDIFNTYNFFDFDYPERPGCDALRSTYFHSETASTELAVAVNRFNRITAALKHHWNRNNVDYQLIAGEQAETDLVIGGALTTDIRGLNFRTEMSYFHPLYNLSDTAGIFSISVGADYIFSNSLMLQTEVLYNQMEKTTSGNGLLGLYAAPLTAKNLSVSVWNIFSQASFPITPRLNSSLSAMYFVDIQSYYAGFSLDFSLVENLDLSFFVQYFAALVTSKLGDMKVLMTFARMKYSF